MAKIEPAPDATAIEPLTDPMHSDRLNATVVDLSQSESGSQVRPPGDLYHVGESVTAPTVVSRVEPDRTAEAIRNNISGFVVVVCEISKEGQAGNIKIAVPLGFGLDEAAIAAVRQWRFSPAMKDGQAVVVTATLEIPFRR